MAAPQSQAHDPLRAAGVNRLVVLAPNWLGDAVMALPAIADVRRASPAATIAVAARPAVAPLFTMVPGVSEVVTLDSRGPAWRDRCAPLRERSFDAALLLPELVSRGAGSSGGPASANAGAIASDFAAAAADARDRASRSACTRRRSTSTWSGARLRERTARAAARRRRRPRARARRRAAARRRGWDGRAPLVALAPGAAYGGAKRWPAPAFAELARRWRRAVSSPVLVGSAADASRLAPSVIAALGDVARRST